MFLDRVRLKLIAGKGGNGVVAWRREKYIPKGGPCGGNGGPGGSIIFRSVDSLYSLDPYRNRRQVKAESGAQGGSNQRQGRKGEDLILNVPCGTLLKDPETEAILFDFTEPSQEFKVCVGGKGGLGNTFFKSPTNRAPSRSTPGKEGEVKAVELELKLIADIGFVGLPSAGKSTLLSNLAQIELKTGAYPFTTLSPNLSQIEFEDYTKITIADIPGIIEKAHQNKGLGLEFLRHIERTKVLLFIIDIADLVTDPIESFEILKNELKTYSPSLIEKPQLVALNKIDILEDPEVLERFKKQNPQSTLFLISALEKQDLEPLVYAMKSLVQTSQK
ncbi:MAG: GTPase ObgE [Simkaniaceae bacterium]